MENATLIQRLLRDAAQRCGIAVPDDFTPAPQRRLGQIFDDLTAPPKGDTPDCSIGPYRFVPHDLALHRQDQVIRLTEKERDILVALIVAGPGSVSRRTMLDEIWSYADGVETHTLETHIYRLRQKIENDPGRPALLLTDGDGYRLAQNIAAP